MTSTARLLQLCSQALPVGAYAYSGGLESAISTGYVFDRQSALVWISGVFETSVAQLDLPALVLAETAWREQDQETLDLINDYLQANRESGELLLEDVDMGRSLQRLLNDLGEPHPACRSPSFVTLFAVAGVNWHIPVGELIAGYCYSWLENQVAAATKSVPLGQTDAQRMLGELLALIDAAVNAAMAIAASESAKDSLEDWSFGRSLPMLGLLSARHETLDARLYRS
ncbi:MAG: urease accessory protein UreF [Pseudomonadales bacterium]|nr:urease accessory protein UreF [Pseudomonadales bacterium]MBO6565708.1 urease accessory protein UreF [Pseudomonadales bacterium]MBO6595120.1 urease accessory protein UreF [Pseudomonadales bacterium]MBO6657148.1 urease accessory protein UreF [Pseudomonadales bacterium]MBO6701625.1 urease accessory protein UreF [Pseudomonadales bacterium]